MKLVSLFSGAGGLDLGFKKAGFKTIWANEYDKKIWETYMKNFPSVTFDKRSIAEISSKEIPECTGIIGGPPCQSWSEAGSLRGISDPRGQLFFEFIRVLKDKKPLFFLAENVVGMLSRLHSDALGSIKNSFREAGYNLSFQLLNAKDYGVPQDRKRIFFIGYRNDLGIQFEFPEKQNTVKTLRDSIWDIRNNALPEQERGTQNRNNCQLPNHEYMKGGFSSIYLSRNRVRSWDEVSFTIQAGGRHAPIHPNAPKMIPVEKDKKIFAPGKEHLYRRLSVRECARIQTFDDSFVFYYKNISDGYKMVGNAVPVFLAKTLGETIFQDLGKLGLPTADSG